MGNTYKVRNLDHLQGLEFFAQTDQYRSYVKLGTQDLDMIEVFGKPDYQLSTHQCVAARSSIVAVLTGEECQLYKLLNWRAVGSRGSHSSDVWLVVFVLLALLLLVVLHLMYREHLPPYSGDPTSRHLYYLLFAGVAVFVVSFFVKIAHQFLFRNRCRKDVQQWVTTKYVLEPDTRVRLRTVLAQLSFAKDHHIAEEAKIALKYVR